MGDAGGGIGQVSSLLWGAFEHAWPADERGLVTLQSRYEGRPTFADKVRFTTTIGASQIRQRARWILFAHMGLVRAERLLPRRVRAPYAVFLHGVEAWRPLSAADRRILGAARLRLANSAFTADQALKANPEIGPVEPCSLALPAQLEAEDRCFAPSVESKKVLIVGRMSAGERYKGHQQLIDLWPDLVAQEREAVLVIVGDGDDRRRLEARARASRAADRIQFKGFVSREELARHYEEASVFAMPSRGEGFGLVYLEAMAHRLACVGSVHDAAREIIVDGQTGLLVDSDRREAVAQAILRLLRDPALRGRLGQAGFDRWRRVFSYDRFRTRVLGLLETALDGCTAREWSEPG